MLGFVQDIDPVMVHLGPVKIHYYGVIFVLTLLVAYWFWRRQMLRGGYSSELAERFMVWGALATIIGARLGHCLFYEPERYLLKDPLSILFIWEGGLASHGATIGLVLALLLFSLIHRLRPIEIMDRFTMSAAVGAAGIRMANFVNSEIVGRASDVPWAVRFPYYSDHGAIARHPSQLYEFALGIFVLLALVLADRWAGKEKRPLGMMTGLFFVLYFAGRFFVEYFKEFQVDQNWERYITMGQVLSIPAFLFGVTLLIWSYLNSRKPQPEIQPIPAATNNNKKKKRSK